MTIVPDLGVHGHLDRPGCAQGDHDALRTSLSGRHDRGVRPRPNRPACALDDRGACQEFLRPYRFSAEGTEFSLLTATLAPWLDATPLPLIRPVNACASGARRMTKE